MPKMSDRDDLMSSQRQTDRIFGWSTSRRVDRSVDSRKWDHDDDSTTFLLDQRPGSSMRS